MKKKGKVLLSDNNSPNRTDDPKETEPGEKKERLCLQITTAQIGLTTQERQNQVKKGKALPSDNNSPHTTDFSRETELGEPGDKTGKKLKNELSSLTEISQVIKNKSL